MVTATYRVNKAESDLFHQLAKELGFTQSRGPAAARGQGNASALLRHIIHAYERQPSTIIDLLKKIEASPCVVSST
jgi:hypothetical protein